MGRAINGKAVNQVMQELAEPFPDDVFETHDGTGRLYIPVTAIKRRLDTVLGLNYDFIPGEINVVAVGEQDNIAMIGIIRIRDDAGNIVSERGSAGGVNVIYPKEKDKKEKNAEGKVAEEKVKKIPIKFSNDCASATKDVLKRAAQLYGIGEQQMHEKRNNVKPGPKVTQQNQSEKYIANIKGGFSTFRTNNGTAYKVPVEINGEKRELLIFNEGQKAIEKFCGFGMNQFREHCTKNISFMGYLNEYQGKQQVILTDLASKEV